MICPDCNGTGWIKFGYEDHWHDVPCMECGGTGIRHCCEGERPGNTAKEIEVGGKKRKVRIFSSKEEWERFKKGEKP